ncbi:MAG: hypothetical protein Q9220_003116 [cf. Caloplaca sp. 1 TL-2023]
MGQFSFRMSEGLGQCYSCGATNAPTVRNLQYLSLDASTDQIGTLQDEFGQRPSIAQLIERELNPLPKKCGTCRSSNGRSRHRLIVGDLPQRLVIFPGENLQAIVSQATSDNVRFRYVSFDGLRVYATYRWLGGIYCKNGHFRVYWTDGEYGRWSKKLKVYDGMCVSGAIVGGVPASFDEKVPACWSRGPVVLFYERVNKLALERAAKSVKLYLDDLLRIESEGARQEHHDITQNSSGILQGNRNKPFSFGWPAKSRLRPAIGQLITAETDTSTMHGSPAIEKSALKSSSSGSNPSHSLRGQAAEEPVKEAFGKKARETYTPEVDPPIHVRGQGPLTDEEYTQSISSISSDDHTPSKGKDDDGDENVDDKGNGNNPAPNSPPSSHQAQTSPRKSPPKTPPAKSPPPTKGPQTPPSTSQRGLFGAFSPSRLLGLWFFVARSGFLFGHRSGVF